MGVSTVSKPSWEDLLPQAELVLCWGLILLRGQGCIIPTQVLQEAFAVVFSLPQLNYGMTDWRHQPSSNHYSYYHTERDRSWPQSPEGEYRVPDFVPILPYAIYPIALGDQEESSWSRSKQNETRELSTNLGAFP